MNRLDVCVHWFGSQREDECLDKRKHTDRDNAGEEMACPPATSLHKLCADLRAMMRRTGRRRSVGRSVDGWMDGWLMS